MDNDIKKQKLNEILVIIKELDENTAYQAIEPTWWLNMMNADRSIRKSIDSLS